MCVIDVEGGKTLPRFVFVMITHGGIKPEATRWSLACMRATIELVFAVCHLFTEQI